MSDQTLIDLAKASINAFGAKDWDAAKSTLAATAIYDEVGTNRQVQGTDDILTLWKGWAAAFPDSKAALGPTYVSGSTVIIELTWHGTHTGTLRTGAGEIPATGRAIALRGCQVIDVANGKIQSVRQYFDTATLMAQLGIASAFTA